MGETGRDGTGNGLLQPVIGVDEFVQSTLAKVGRGETVLAPYWLHELMSWWPKLLPELAREWLPLPEALQLESAQRCLFAPELIQLQGHSSTQTSSRMASPPSSGATGCGYQRSLTPTATAFTPKAIEATKEVLGSGFITHAVPSVHRNAGIVGICTVPEAKADTSDLGWHIADFLAFKALLCGDNHPRAQTWLAMCDIPALIEANPDRYVHGKDRRLVGSAAKIEKRQGPRGLVDREDNIQVETSTELFKEKFIVAMKEKLAIVKKMRYQLLLIICGLTSPEQDIYLGKIDADHRYTLKDLRQDLGDDINHVEAMVITPSLFSPGWQIDISFGGLTPTEMRGGRIDFLARQFGGLFSRDISNNFLGWQCPVLDEAMIDPLAKERERFPGPVCPSDEVKALNSQLRVGIQSCLVGGFSNFYLNHSLSFDKNNDEWEVLIGDREKSPDYRGLDWYERIWTKLAYAQSLESSDEGLEFLGNSFGGTRESQLNHIRYLIDESYLAWPDHWESNYGQETKEHLERLMNTEHADDLDYHEVFNVLEHRAKQSILADTIIRYFDLPIPHNQRCRDWDHLKWKQELSATDRSALIKYFGTVLGCVPGPNLPPGVNQNNLSKIQRRLETGANYVRAALGVRFLTAKGSTKAATDRIEHFLHEVKLKQIELLSSNSEIYRLCCMWLQAIGMPVRELGNAIFASGTFEAVGSTEDITGIVDCDDDYDVYRDEDAHLGVGASFTVAGNTPGEFVSVLHLPPPCEVFSPFQQQKAHAAEHRKENFAHSEQGTIAATPSIVAAHANREENIDSPEEMEDGAARESSLIVALQNTNDREERAKLTVQLYELLHKSAGLGVGAKSSSNVARNGTPKAINNGTTETASQVATENNLQDCSQKQAKGE
ncbi:hypothetical protein NUW58_g8506 [Xylaria curta]|uniref:Uncharacterized protein n=1 Tax=Xylaria curta TaxID=42375 RepID=A0ACC1N6K1_9PEZI|nr:hypothetical protein NUW58_g8506 [Xylaria curta]